MDRPDLPLPWVDGGRCALIGMVHLRPLPGSAGWRGGSIQLLLDAALADAEQLLEGGCDGLMVENMGDRPYLRGRVHPETVAAMAIATERVVRLGAPTGVQVLAGANREALGVAVAAGARFIRVEAYAYAHVADEGWMDACAGELSRARAALGCTVDIWADVQKKHAAHVVTGDLSLSDLAKGHAFCGADALIVTGTATGQPTSPSDVLAASTAGLPVLVGSGVDEHNAASLSALAQGLIVGTALKRDGDWSMPVDPARVRRIKERMRG